MSSQELINKESKFIMDTFARYPLVIEKGFGALLYDCEGKEYIDFSSGIGVNCLGSGDEEWANAIYTQAKNLGHISNLYYNSNMINLAEVLTSKTKMSKAFFANSGAEANEGAIKLARKYSFQKYGKFRSNIICLNNSFHGRTITTLAATGQQALHKFFYPFTKGFFFANANDIESVKKLIDKSICAIMIELIQGEGGIFPLEKEFVAQVKQLCVDNDILLIIDEIQTGIGRTGAFLASEYYEVKADIITLAKGLGGGLPIGAFLCNETLEKVLDKGSHGSTFGANPICCAGALVVLNRLDNKLLDEVLAKGEYMKNKLLAMKGVLDVRGKGLMLGFDIEGIGAKPFTMKLLEKGLLAITANTAVRLMPPLIIGYKEIDKGLKIIEDTLKECSQ